jgi:hypothetical protein
MTIRSHPTSPKRAVLGGAIAVALLGLGAAPVLAQPTTERPASLTFFPEVVSDVFTDTRIQISNTRPFMIGLLCIYLDGQSGQQTNFGVELGADATLTWVVSQGFQTGEISSLVPPVNNGFSGALLCVEQDQGGFPVPANSVIGTATQVQPQSGEIAQYNAVGLLGTDLGNGDDFLELGTEYTGCPTDWLLTHVVEDNGEGFADEAHTRLAILTCSQDFFSMQRPETPEPGLPFARVNFQVTNEFEELFSAQIDVASFAIVHLASIGIFTPETLGTDYALTRITSMGSGILVTATETRLSDGVSAASGINLHPLGTRPEPDAIRLPIFRTF